MFTSQIVAKASRYKPEDLAHEGVFERGLLFTIERSNTQQTVSFTYQECIGTLEIISNVHPSCLGVQ